ncbi:hypothetical protein J2X46_000934 [Nocardioides sp. BE266]|uniref:hypothetical protein n=1 Tax=Nocardioides sp. BE266 TaxID=2817725 RepID=UPI0028633981|nr:hypothetical protein [Nocardioides sp. BE266]MDR7251958.1 hypothetical protein [Nocardioides sp. BE266]
MSKPTEQRPPQVSLASGIVMFASALVLITSWEQVSSLGSLETQRAIDTFLSEPPFSSLGLDMESTRQLLRITAMVSAVAACATAILGWYVRKPDRGARLGLTVFAVPVFLAGMPSGGLAGAFVAAGAAMLWMVPAREWFATGKWTPPEPAPKPDPVSRTTPEPGNPGWTTPPAPTEPRPAERPFGTPPMAPGWPAPAQQGPPPSWQEHQVLLHTRPGAMVTAFVLTVVMAGGLLALSLLWIAMAGLSPDFLMSVLEQQQPELIEDGVTLQQVQGTVYLYAGAFVVWCIAALVFAGFAMARRDWARRALMLTAAFSAGGCLVFVLNTVLVVVPAAAAVATVVCLRRVEVRRWFALEPR